MRGIHITRARVYTHIVAPYRSTELDSAADDDHNAWPDATSPTAAGQLLATQSRCPRQSPSTRAIPILSVSVFLYVCMCVSVLVFSPIGALLVTLAVGPLFATTANSPKNSTHRALTHDTWRSPPHLLAAL